MASAKDKALEVAMRYGQAPEPSHKAWVIDQMVRVLTGDGYAKWVSNFRRGEQGADTYVWDQGTAP